MIDKRKPGQSLLDYLWTNFGNLEVSNLLNENPSNEVLLTEVAIVNLLKNNLSKVDAVLDSKIDGNTVTLLIKDLLGTVLSQISFDRGIVKLFDKFISSEDDVIDGKVSKSGLTCLSLKDSLGQEFIIELMSGTETDSITTVVKDNKIVSRLKIDNPVDKKAVELIESSNGLQANLLINNKSSVKAEKTEDGLLIHQTWEGEEFDLKFKALIRDEYFLLKEIDNGTIYFLVDVPCIYFRNVKYASAADIVDDKIKDIFDKYSDEFTEQINDLNESVTINHTWIEL